MYNRAKSHKEIYWKMIKGKANGSRLYFATDFSLQRGRYSLDLGNETSNRG